MRLEPISCCRFCQGARIRVAETAMLHIEGMLAIPSFAEFDDHSLVVKTKSLAEDNRLALVLLVAALAELDARRLYLREGYASLFVFCTEALRLSESAAYNRIEAARAIRRWPMLLEMLADGSLNLTTLRLVAPLLTAENHQEILAAVRGKTRREVEYLLATRRPPMATQSVITPLGADLYQIQIAVSKETFEVLCKLQDLLRHQLPDGDPAVIVTRGLKTLLDVTERKKLAIVGLPRAPRRVPAKGRHIPAAIRREVWTRDSGRCAFVGRAGRCTQRGFLELHHVVPFAAGGATSAANLQLRCKAHNAYEAQQWLGRASTARSGTSSTRSGTSSSRSRTSGSATGASGEQPGRKRAGGGARRPSRR